MNLEKLVKALGSVEAVEDLYEKLNAIADPKDVWGPGEMAYALMNIVEEALDNG